MNSRIFLSGVTREVGSARDLASVVLRKLDYEPVDMPVFSTGAGDLGQVLRGHIDGCEGLIHLVGHAYGAEPPEPDPYKGRNSYTQLEQLYAEQRGLKTWVFLLSDDYPTDLPRDQLDLPEEPKHPDPLGYQRDRRKWQREWRARFERGRALFHRVGSAQELEIKLLGIQDELAAVRGKFRRMLTGVLVALGLVILLGVLNLASSCQTAERSRDRLKAVEEPPPAIVGKVRTEDDDIKRRLHDSIETIYEQEVKSAESQKGWKDKGDAENAARTKRDYRRGLADTFVDSLRVTSQADGTRPELAELRRVLKNSGDVEAIRYLESQESRLLAEAEKNLRLTLAPLLEGVRLHVIRGEYPAAKTKCETLLAKDGDWPELLLVYTNVLIRHGDQIHNDLRFPEGTKLRLPNGNGHLYLHGHGAFRLHRGTSQRIDHPVALAADRSAERQYEVAVNMASRLVAADPGNSEKRFSLGEAFLRRSYVIPLPQERVAADRLLRDAYDLFDALAKKHPADVRYATQLATALDSRCVRLFASGRTAEGIADLDRAVEIRRWLVSVRPAGQDQITDLMNTFTAAITIQRRLGDTAKALAYARSCLDAAESARLSGKSNLYECHIRQLRENVADLESAVIATGDWDRLLRHDATAVPRLLEIRVREFAAPNRIGDAANRLRAVAQAADKLREFPASTVVPNSDGATAPAGPAPVLTTRYAAARAYGDCAALVGQGKDKLDADELAARTKYLDLSLACLQESVAAGFNDFEYLEADDSFTQLRERPEYKALFPRK